MTSSIEILYISGPMTGVTDFNYPLFNQVAKFFRGIGIEVRSPAEIDDAAQINKICYHCDLPIVPLDAEGEYSHKSMRDYTDWLASHPMHKAHEARFEPLCVHCGRDNANGTHSALEGRHLDHRFSTEHPWQYYMQKAIAMQMESTAWAGLPGWPRSRGAKREFDLAVDLQHKLYVVKFNREGDPFLEVLG